MVNYGEINQLSCEMHSIRAAIWGKKTLSKWKVTQPHHRWGAMRQALQTNIGVCLPQAPFFWQSWLTNHSCDDSYVYESLMTFEDRLWITSFWKVLHPGQTTPGGIRKLTILHYAVDTMTGSKVRCCHLGWSRIDMSLKHTTGKAWHSFDHCQGSSNIKIQCNLTR